MYRTRIKGKYTVGEYGDTKNIYIDYTGIHRIVLGGQFLRPKYYRLRVRVNAVGIAVI